MAASRPPRAIADVVGFHASEGTRIPEGVSPTRRNETAATATPSPHWRTSGDPSQLREQRRATAGTVVKRYCERAPLNLRGGTAPRNSDESCAVDRTFREGLSMREARKKCPEIVISRR